MVANLLFANIPFSKSNLSWILLRIKHSPEHVHSAPVVRERIPNGQAQITGQFTPDEAKDLATVLSLRLEIHWKIFMKEIMWEQLQ